MKEFIDLCKYFGNQEEWIQGAGGNISMKISSNEMIVKSSGSLLKNAEYVKVNHHNLKKVEGKGRPSMETGFHAILGKVVVHTHPVWANLIACLVNGEELMRKIFPQKNCYWIDYKSPGKELTEEIRKVSENLNLNDNHVFFLENHGLIISSNSDKETIRIHQEIDRRIKNYFPIPEYNRKGLIKHDEGYISQNDNIEFFGYLFPDIIVFGEEIFDQNKNEKFEFKNGKLIYKTSYQEADNCDAILYLYTYLLNNLPRLGRTKFLSENEVNHIKNMKEEKYRKEVNEKMKIIIPMTGVGRRFKEAGYSKIKPLIEIDGKPMIEHVISMFPNQEFVFIVNEDHPEAAEFLKGKGEIVIEKDHKKLGPVFHTLLANIEDDEEVIVCYCDFFMEFDLEDFKEKVKGDGAVITYKGFHPHLLHEGLYGSLLVDENNFMVDYKEKHSWTENNMDCHQSAGAYYFKKGKYIKKYFQEVLLGEENFNGEFYVSQAYPLMKKDGLKTYVYEVNKFCQWGVPRDLEEYKFWAEVFKKKKEDDRTYQYWKEFFYDNKT